jgi:LPPG:FO 2-phospho-L-lactate transferase
VVESIEQAELIVICPSNPFISIWPILAVAEIREALERRRVPSIAVSPLVGGRAIKGPADRMLERLAGGTEPVRVAACYQGVVDALVLDESDAGGAAGVGLNGVRAVVTKTLMQDSDAAAALARVVLDSA